MALAVASTVVLIRVLADHRALHTPVGHIGVGWLVVEDVFTVLALVLLPTLFGNAGSRRTWRWLGLTALKVVARRLHDLVGNRAIPFLLDQVTATSSRASSLR